MIIPRAAKYLKYILLSSNRRGHGIHSPFVFDIVSRIFRNKIDPGIVCTIEKARRRMRTDRRSIVIKDLGSGSDDLKTKIRKVSSIARHSPVPEKYGILLSNMAAEFGEPLIIELGTSLGISTMYLAASSSVTKVSTIEGCSSISEIAEENFKEAEIGNIEVLKGSFDDLLPVILKRNIKPGLVFIDGNHRKEPLIKYFTQIAEISDNKTVIILDDINYSKEMQDAWQIIKQFEKVSVTIDIFRMGIVFFREGMTHKNYVIRY